MRIKHLIFGALAIVFIGLCAAVFCMESIVKSAVHKFGSQVTGTEVSLRGFSLNPFRGTAEVKGLTVANPKNYKTPYLFDLGGISVKIDMSSVLSDTIVIDDITVSKPVITYEILSLNQNNIKQIQENISKNTASPKPQTSPSKEESKAKDSAPAKKVIIRKITIAEGGLQALTTIQDKTSKVDVTLPAIVLTDIGTDKKGQSVAASISKIITKILNTATQTVVKSNLGDVKKIAEQNLDNAVDTVKGKIKSLGIFGKK